MAILDNIIHWAKGEEAIRVVVMTGSRAGKGPVDDLSDYDLAIFTCDADKYTRDDAWLQDIAEVVVCVEDQTYDDLGPTQESPWAVIPEQHFLTVNEIPTRLVIFKGGFKVDFAFYPLMTLDRLVIMAVLPFAYDMGYKILLDKDEITKSLPKPTFTVPISEKPSQEEFDRVVREFFFEVYHVAKHLKRDDLWHAKFRDWTTKEFLLKMIEWYELAQHNWQYDVCYLGKKMKSWVDGSTWTALSNVFGHFDAGDGWKALEMTIELFRKLATKLANTLSYEYPYDVDRSITILALEQIKTLKLHRNGDKNG
jgi:aminoglycoside 6-adenylyltransferase